MGRHTFKYPQRMVLNWFTNKIGFLSEKSAIKFVPIKLRATKFKEIICLSNSAEMLVKTSTSTFKVTQHLQKLADNVHATGARLLR